MKKQKKGVWKRGKGLPRGAKVATISRLSKARFLAAFSRLGNITAAAEKARVSRRIVPHWREHDPAFSAAFDQAAVEATDRLEAEARRRAVDGVDEPVFHRGEEVATVKKYSDLLLIFLLKGALPSKYRERHEVTGAGGGPIELSAYVYLPSNGREAAGAELREAPAEVADFAQLPAPAATVHAAVELPPDGRANGGPRP